MKNGNTALHDFCTESCQHFEIFRLLLTNGVTSSPGEYQLKPIVYAAMNGNAPLVEYLLTRPEFDELEKIEALELLGATYSKKAQINGYNNKDDDEMSKNVLKEIHKFWQDSLNRRNEAIVSFISGRI